MFIKLQVLLAILPAICSSRNSGMQIRLEEDTIEGLKNVMARFMPRYLAYDANLPTDFEYKFDNGIGLLDWHFVWSNITYSTPKLDIVDIDVKLTAGHHQPLVSLEFPAIEEWEISAH